jgi:hypothetical protein
VIDILSERENIFAITDHRCNHTWAEVTSRIYGIACHKTRFNSYHENCFLKTVGLTSFHSESYTDTKNEYEQEERSKTLRGSHILLVCHSKDKRNKHCSTEEL